MTCWDPPMWWRIKRTLFAMPEWIGSNVGLREKKYTLYALNSIFSQYLFN